MKRVSWILIAIALLCLLCGVALATGDTLTPPTLTIPVDTFYPGMYVEATADPGWDELMTKITLNGDSYQDDRWTSDNRFVAIEFKQDAVVGEYSLYVKGRKGEDWSDWSEPIPLIVGTVPSVEDMVIQGPMTAQEGENIVFTLLFPENTDAFYVTCYMSNGYETEDYVSSNHLAICRIRAINAGKYGMSPGEYTLTFVVKDNSWNIIEIKEVSFKIIGESLIAPTMQAKSTALDNGSQITLSGTTGSAETFHLQMDASSNGAANYAMGRTETWITPEGESWSYKIDDVEGGVYNFTLTGYTAAGLCTGQNTTIVVVEDEYSLPAPTLSLEQNSIYVDQRLHFTSSVENISSPHWYYSIANETGEIISSWDTWTDDGQFDNSIYPSEAGNGILTVLYNDGKNWSSASTASFTVSEWPEITLASIPDQIYIGGRVSIEANPVENVTSYEFIILDRPGNCVFYAFSDTSSVSSITWWYSDREIKEGTHYLYLRGYGMDGNEIARSKKIPVSLVTATAPAAPVISWSDDSTSVMDNTVLTVVLDRDDYESFLFHCIGEDDDFYIGPYENPGKEIQFGLNVGTWTILGYYIEDGIQSEWSTPLTITVLERPKLDSLMNLYLPDTWPAYKDYAFEWVQSEAEEVISIDLNGCGWYSSDGTTQAITAESLEPGTYTLRASASAEGYANWYFEREITVTANASMPAPPKVTIPVEKYYVGQNQFHAKVDNGWNQLIVQFYSKNGEKWDSFYTFETTSITLDTYDYFTEAGNYSVLVKGRKGDTWSDWSEPIILTVAEMPDVSEISLEGPDSFQIGEDIVCTVLIPEKLDAYYVHYSLGGVGSGFYGHLSGTIRLPGSEFVNKAPGNYTLNISVHDSEWNEIETAKYTVTLTGKSLNAPTMTTQSLVVNSGDAVRLSGDAGSASLLYLQYYYDQNNGNHAHHSVWITPESDGTWGYTTAANGSGQFYFTVNGYTDDALSAGYKYLRVLVEDDNSLDAPELSLGQDIIYPDQGIDVFGKAGYSDIYQEWNYTITNEAGEIVYSSYMWETDGQHMSTFSLPEAGHYTLKAFYSEGNKWSKAGSISFTVQDWPEIPFIFFPEQFIIDGRINIEVEPTDGVYRYEYIIGDSNNFYVYDYYHRNSSLQTLNGWYNNAEITEGTYYLLVRGYDDMGNDVARSRKVPVSLTTGNAPAAPALKWYVDASTALEDSPLNLILDRADYETYQIRYKNTENDTSKSLYEHPGEEITLYLNIGDWMIQGRYLSEEGIWSEWSAPLTITILEAPKLDSLMNLTLPDTWPAYKDYAFEWIQSDAQEEVSIYLNGTRWYSTFITEQTINAETLSPGTYMVYVTATAKGYANLHIAKEITITENPDRPEPPKVTLPLEHFYAGMGLVDSKVDSGWDKLIVVFYGVNGEEISTSYTLAQDYITLDFVNCFREPGNYSIAVKGNKDGTWSEWSELIAMEVEEMPIESNSVITLPAGLKVLESGALAGISAAKIIVPDGCTQIDSYAFAENSLLRKIVIPASVTTIDTDAFAGLPSGVIIVTPAGSAAEQLAIQMGLIVENE